MFRRQAGRRSELVAALDTIALDLRYAGARQRELVTETATANVLRRTQIELLREMYQHQLELEAEGRQQAAQLQQRWEEDQQRVAELGEEIAVASGEMPFSELMRRVLEKQYRALGGDPDETAPPG